MSRGLQDRYVRVDVAVVRFQCEEPILGLTNALCYKLVLKIPYGIYLAHFL